MEYKKGSKVEYFNLGIREWIFGEILGDDEVPAKYKYSRDNV